MPAESEGFNKYEDIIKALPYMPIDKIRWLIADLKLELKLREKKTGSI